jgi:hypothetical protein
MLLNDRHGDLSALKGTSSVGFGGFESLERDEVMVQLRGSWGWSLIVDGSLLVELVSLRTLRFRSFSYPGDLVKRCRVISGLPKLSASGIIWSESVPIEAQLNQVTKLQPPAPTPMLR